MKEKILIASLLLPASALGLQAEESRFTLTSPDNNYTFTFTQETVTAGRSQMYYSISYGQQTVIEKSELGVTVDNQYFESALGVPNDSCRLFCENMQLIGQETSTHDSIWTPLYGENAQIRDHYNSLILQFKKGDGKGNNSGNSYNKERTYFMNVEVRAYDEGVAFRYHFPTTTNGLFIHITSEQTQFSLPEGTMAYYEKWAQGPYSLLPLEGWTAECERPLTMKLTNGLTVALAEAKVVDYVRTKFELDPQKKNALRAALYDCADIITPYDTPWRVVMAATRPIELVTREELLLNLNDPCALTDVSFVKPGKVFRCCRLTQKDVLEGIDFAAERGLQYAHLDAGWYGPEWLLSSDAATVADGKDLNLKAICDYAKSKGIGIFVYVNQRALSQQLDEILPLYKEWGIAGIKFGFVQIGNQYWTTWLHQAIRKCAQYGMLIDIHDEYRPTGYSRTYPNLLTQEGVRGNEEMPDAEHNTTLPFTRFIAGPADYTLCYYSEKVKNTHAHQLAMAAVYYSPLTYMYWYDMPALYHGEEETNFWKRIPTSWDETYPIDGEIGQYVAIARRKESKWYVGIMNGLEARSLVIATDFLKKGKKYEVTLYQDNPELKTRTNVETTHKTIRGGEKLTFKLLGSGGVALEIVEK